MTTTDRQPTTPGQALRRAALTHRCAAPGEHGTVEERVQLERLADDLDAAPATFSLPAEPPPEVTVVWDRDGEQYCRLDSPLPTGESWVHRDTPLDEVHITEEAAHWRELLVDHGPLSTVPPERTEAP